jgi:hypothetical protein
VVLSEVGTRGETNDLDRETFEIAAGVLRVQAIPVAEWSKARFCDSSLAGIVCSDPADRLDVCRKCCVLSDRGIRDGPITRLEDSYQLSCIIVCELGT